MNIQKALQEKRNRLHNKIRAKINGTASRPRLSVYRSLRGLNLQLIDDVAGKTLVSVNSREVKAASKVEVSLETGKLLAKKAQEQGISEVVFDRGRYLYHGRVKAAAEGAREGGLIF